MREVGIGFHEQHICECGSKHFRALVELHFDAEGPYNPQDGWRFECPKCDRVYDIHGIEIKEDEDGTTKNADI